MMCRRRAPRETLTDTRHLGRWSETGGISRCWTRPPSRRDPASMMRAGSKTRRSFAPRTAISSIIRAWPITRMASCPMPPGRRSTGWRRAASRSPPPSRRQYQEATVDRTADGRWRLFYEYAADEASRIAWRSRGCGGPWTEQPTPFMPREKAGMTGISRPAPADRRQNCPVMFYNGATRDARWRIGWVAFDEHYTRVVARGIEPLILPPPADDRGATDIAFAASVVVAEDGIWLYYSLEDRRLSRALIRAVEPPVSVPSVRKPVDARRIRSTRRPEHPCLDRPPRPCAPTVPMPVTSCCTAVRRDRARPWGGDRCPADRRGRGI